MIPEAAKNPWVRTILPALAGVLLGAFLVRGCAPGSPSPESSPPDPDPPAAIETRDRGETPAAIDREKSTDCFVGALVPREEVDVAAEVEGIVEIVHLRVGDRVAAGEPVAELDTRTLRHRLAMEQANLKNAEAEIKKQSVEVDRSAQEHQRRLALSGLVSREESEAARFRMSSAQAALEAAEAQAGQVRARIRELEDALDRSTLRAPFPGLVSRRYLDPGSRTDPGTPVARLVRLDDLMVRFAVPPETAETLRPGTPVRAELSEPTRPLHGTVEHVSPEIDPASLLVFVEADLEAPSRTTDTPLFGSEARVRLSDDPSAPSCLR